MALRDEYHLEDLKNMAEDLVVDQMELQLESKHPDLAITEDLVLDIAAYALNLIKPMYRVNLMGRMYTHAFSEMYHNEIVDAVEKAITKVVANPDGPTD
jgi:competence protein ComFB